MLYSSNASCIIMKNNQVEHRFPEENRVKQFSVETPIKNKDSPICHVLRYFLRMWLPLIGIHLIKCPSQSITKWLQIMHRFVSLFFILITNIYLLALACGNQQDFSASLLGDQAAEGNKTSSTFAFTILVDYGNTIIRNVGILVIVVFRTDKLFAKLGDSVDKTETHLLAMMNQREYQYYYSKYRKLSIAGIVYIFTAVALLSSAVTMEMIDDDESLFRILLEMNCFLTFVFPMSVLVLFCLLCSLISNQLRTIAKLVRKLPIDGGKQLKELQIEHARISASVYLINRTFGPILFLEISYIFIAVIVNFVYCMAATLASVGTALNFLIFLVLFCNAFDLILVSYCADNLKNRSHKLELLLFQMRQQNLVFERQITSFAGQVSKLHPQITAGGFFSIGKELIPTLIGTTLTYFFITYQFHSDEISKEKA